MALPAVFVLLAVLVSAPSAAAQTIIRREAPRAGSWEVGGGFRWGASSDLGERRAQQTRNPTTGSGAFDLFVARSTLEASAGAEGHLAFYITPAVAIEAAARYAQPRLRVRLSGDAEDAEATTAEETIGQYQFDGSVVLHLRNLRFARGRAVPFVTAGAGHIRDLHQGNELVETGTAIHGGAGLKWWFGTGLRRLGLRVDARATSRQGGFSFGDERRTVPSAGVSLAYLF